MLAKAERMEPQEPRWFTSHTFTTLHPDRPGDAGEGLKLLMEQHSAHTLHSWNTYAIPHDDDTGIVTQVTIALFLKDSHTPIEIPYPEQHQSMAWEQGTKRDAKKPTATSRVSEVGINEFLARYRQAKVTKPVSRTSADHAILDLAASISAHCDQIPHEAMDALIEFVKLSHGNKETAKAFLRG